MRDLEQPERLVDSKVLENDSESGQDHSFDEEEDWGIDEFSGSPQGAEDLLGRYYFEEGEAAAVDVDDLPLELGPAPDLLQNQAPMPLPEHPLDQAFQAPVEEQDAVRRKGQERYIKVYNGLVGSRSPLRVLRTPGGSYIAEMSSKLSVDVIAVALAAGAFGIPVPSSLLARLGPKFKLQVTGDLVCTDADKVKATLQLSITGGFTASIAKSLGLNANLMASVSTSMSGVYDSLDHFVAHYLRNVTDLITTAVGYKPFKAIKRRVRKARGAYVKKENLAEYEEIRKLERRRRTKVKAVGVGGKADISAAAGLVGGGMGMSVKRKRFTRKRNIDEAYDYAGSKRHEKKHGLEAEGSIAFAVGPLNGTLKLSSTYNDANPDNDGTYITLTLGGAANAILELAQGAPEALSEITFSVGGMEILKETLSATITGMIPFVAGSFGLDIGKELTLVWYKSGEWKELVTKRHVPFNLLYVRTTQKLGGNVGASMPAVYGLGVGFGLGGKATRVKKERLGHSSIAYVQARYMGMRGHARTPGAPRGRSDSWLAWQQEHEADLRKIWASPHVREELNGLTSSLPNSLAWERAQTCAQELDRAYASHDYEQWLFAVEELFEAEASARSSGPLSRGFTAYASLGDRAKNLRK